MGWYHLSLTGESVPVFWEYDDGTEEWTDIDDDTLDDDEAPRPQRP